LKDDDDDNQRNESPSVDEKEVVRDKEEHV
jgi:hypothetical protein